MIDWLLLILPGCIWGASFLFIAEGLESVAPNGVTFIRILIGFLTLSTIPAARRPIADACPKSASIVHPLSTQARPRLAKSRRCAGARRSKKEGCATWHT